MRLDFGLQALSQIQALDALPIVKPYRDKWLDGTVLDDADMAHDWIRARLDGETACGQTFQLAPAGMAPRGTTWLAFSADGPFCDLFTPPPESAVGQLGRLAAQLGDAFGSEWYEAGALFVLTGVVPKLTPVRWEVRPQSNLDDTIAQASNPFFEEIVMTIRVHATLEDVTRAYQTALAEVYDDSPLAPRKRIKPMASERTRDLAIIGGRVARHEFDTWAHALDAYATEHPDDVTYHQPYTPPNRGRFRRDVRDAYRRVTGLELDFQPQRESRPPAVGVNLGDTGARPALRFTPRARSQRVDPPADTPLLDHPAIKDAVDCHLSRKKGEGNAE